ncbi:hypothetical protein Glov_2057 [Trichlorobacter lovleyi SZ]|uniref:Uncharacterized protein n=1 Tax=Trichlorobacter lovleyi (strain ATCC BAA-1151 / DSM 17278 / SZ) TaxID=398767 RepID=B3E3F4_TRIL1|nr:hypothetical protein Glov_2057 [Trichlorobacter lovleyi SZ]
MWSQNIRVEEQTGRTVSVFLAVFTKFVVIQMQG